MKVSKRQLRRIIREEKARLQEVPVGLSSQTPADDLGVLIEKAIDAAQIAREREVLEHLQMAHEALTGM